MTEQPERVTVTLSFSPRTAARLAALGADESGDPLAATVEAVLYELADHAQQAVYRPGAWEREWACQAFGYDWLENLEPDPDHPDTGWQRPKVAGQP